MCPVFRVVSIKNNIAQGNHFTLFFVFLCPTANRVEHILPQAHFHFSCKPPPELVSNPLHRYHHGSDCEVKAQAFFVLSERSPETDKPFLDIVLAGNILHCLSFPLQAVLCIPHRHTVQEGWDPVLGFWVSKTNLPCCSVLHLNCTHLSSKYYCARITLFGFSPLLKQHSHIC